ncbi:MAG: M67 family metallopeptidase [Erythrobacter sp.]|uniref:M67 family metallopeptidase n=1 Tax=Erythrobacter sp. TaxID=1042 RepID=UPI002628DE76|nr:M67 family metallopeptidase [Erythrobacter sp.]MDJ0978890.1 M67 family metallopeptidase [Erythrobacter sp.]
MEPILSDLLGSARQSYPQECCGLLLGGDGVITQARPARNVHPTPQTHFEIDPRALIDAHREERQGGLEVIGYYHSHPTGDTVPSARDAAQAAGDGRIWAIVARNAVRFWKSTSNGFRELSIPIIKS